MQEEIGISEHFKAQDGKSLPQQVVSNTHSATTN